MLDLLNIATKWGSWLSSKRFCPQIYHTIIYRRILHVAIVRVEERGRPLPNNYLEIQLPRLYASISKSSWNLSVLYGSSVAPLTVSALRLICTVSSRREALSAPPSWGCFRVPFGIFFRWHISISLLNRHCWILLQNLPPQDRRPGPSICSSSSPVSLYSSSPALANAFAILATLATL